MLIKVQLVMPQMVSLFSAHTTQVVAMQLFKKSKQWTIVSLTLQMEIITITIFPKPPQITVTFN